MRKWIIILLLICLVVLESCVVNGDNREPNNVDYFLYDFYTNNVRIDEQNKIPTVLSENTTYNYSAYTYIFGEEDIYLPDTISAQKVKTYYSDIKFDFLIGTFNVKEQLYDLKQFNLLYNYSIEESNGLILKAKLRIIFDGTYVFLDLINNQNMNNLPRFFRNEELHLKFFYPLKVCLNIPLINKDFPLSYLFNVLKYKEFTEESLKSNSFMNKLYQNNIIKDGVIYYPTNNIKKERYEKFSIDDSHIHSLRENGYQTIVTDSYVDNSKFNYIYRRIVTSYEYFPSTSQMEYIYNVNGQENPDYCAYNVNWSSFGYSHIQNEYLYQNTCNNLDIYSLENEYIEISSDEFFAQHVYELTQPIIFYNY